MESKELIKGTLKTIILRLLLENKKMYGYEITQAVKKASGGKIKLNYGALYPALHKLENDGLLKTSTKEVDNRLRKYYSLNTKGVAYAESKLKEYEAFSSMMKSLLLSGNS